MTPSNRRHAAASEEGTLRFCAEAFCQTLHQTGGEERITECLSSLCHAYSCWQQLQPSAPPSPTPDPNSAHGWPAAPLVGQESKRQPLKLFRSPMGRRALDVLPKLGMELIGQGDDALVFALAQNAWVLRLAQNPEPFRRYVALGETIGSPHLPAVWANLIVNDFSVACVERLVHLEAQASWARINSAANLAHAIVDGRPWRAEDHGILEDSLRTAVGAIAEGAREHYYALDLSVENIMVRPSTGHIVFNDPWAPWGE